MGESGNGNVAGQRIENSARPVVVLRRGNNPETGSTIGRGPGPGIVVRRKLLFEEKNGLSFAHRQVQGRSRHAVTGGGNDGHAIGGSIDQLGRGCTIDFRPAEEFVGRDLPGVLLGRQAGLPRLDDSVHQGRHVSAVQVRNVSGNVEQMALAGNHDGDSVSSR